MPWAQLGTTYLLSDDLFMDSGGSCAVKKIKIAEGICRIMEEEDCSRAVAETKVCTRAWG
jgi:hypothetical protein